MKIYCLSGLGADEKAFKYIQPKGVELIHLKWIDPKKDESLESYARRMFEEYIPNEEYYLMGLSFGGMLAQEFSKIRKPKKLFLISTINNRSQLGTFYRALGFFKLYQLIPNRSLTSTSKLTRYIFGTQDARVDGIFKQIQADGDPNYIRWAMSAILNWYNNSIIEGIRIHGDNDKLLPYRNNIDYRIKGGGHLMLIDYGAEVTKIIEENLKE